MAYYTVHDALAHLLDFVGSKPGSIINRHARRAINAAYRELVNSDVWTYLLKEDRIATNAPVDQSAGSLNATISYTHSTRTVTLSSGSPGWPDWAAYGRIIISGVSYEVQERTSTTALILSSTSNPGANVAGGTSFTLYRDTYPLPSDFVRADQMFEINGQHGLSYVHPAELVNARRDHGDGGDPQRYTIVGDSDLFGKMALRLTPYPTSARNYDFFYYRRPRDLAIDYYKAGSVTTAVSTTVTGNSTAFTSSMVGSVIRIAPTAFEAGQGASDNDPYAYERMTLGFRYLYERRITAVNSATELVVDSALPAVHTAVRYVISDPLDIEVGTMQTAFERMAEAEMAKITRDKRLIEVLGLVQPQLDASLRADMRSMAMSRDRDQSIENQRSNDRIVSPNS